MKIKRISVTLLALIVLVSAFVFPIRAEDGAAWDGSSTATPAGSGTAADPYRISSGAELKWFSDKVGEKVAILYAVLTADIDLGGAEWSPIGTSTNIYFRGVFDGQGHSVTNFKVTGRANSGLFGAAIVDGTVIRNLWIDDAVIETVKDTTGFGGALLGYGDRVTVENVHVGEHVTVTGYNAGGLIGRAWNKLSTVSYCTSLATVSTDGAQGGEAAGGIVGLAAAVNISYCANGGSISTVTNGEQLAGGIAGRFGGSVLGSIRYCLNTGSVSSTHTAGGIAGKNMFNGCTYENCVSTVPVTAGLSDWSGSLVGRFSTNSGAMTNCYAPATERFALIGKNSANAAKCEAVNVVDAAGNAGLLAEYAAILTKHITAGTEAPFGFAFDEEITFKGAQDAAHDGLFDLRFVANIGDYTQYEEIGFAVDAVYSAGAYTEKHYEKACGYVYSSLLGADGSDTVLYYAAEFQGQYLFAYVIRNIPVAVGEAVFTVTPYGIRNGVRTNAASYTVTCRDGQIVGITAVTSAE